jgi:hypothetical protein
MKIPEKPTEIGNSTILINGTWWPVIDIKIVPGKYSNESLLSFNWTFIEFTPS